MRTHALAVARRDGTPGASAFAPTFQITETKKHVPFDISGHMFFYERYGGKVRRKISVCSRTIKV
jgi:hypothetical protein